MPDVACAMLLWICDVFEYDTEEQCFSISMRQKSIIGSRIPTGAWIGASISRNQRRGNAYHGLVHDYAALGTKP